MAFIKYFLLCLGFGILPLSLCARTYTLKSTIFSSNRIVNLDRLFTNASELKNYSIVVDKSKYLNNEKLSQILQEKGVTAPIILGAGVKITRIVNLDTIEVLKERVNSMYPQLDIDWQGILFPYSEFSLSDFQVTQKENFLEVNVDLDISVKPKSYNKKLRLKLNYSNRVQVSDHKDPLYVEDVQGHVAHLVYRKGGLLLHMKADILMDLGQGWYKVKSPLNGKIMKVKLYDQKENS